MFRNPTVFVLGAGASKESGLPLGADLAASIERAGQYAYDGTREGGDPILRNTFNKKYGSEKWGTYANAALALSSAIPGYQTIDEALHFFAEQSAVIEFGKAAIARFIIAGEQSSSLHLKNRSEKEATDLARRTWLFEFYRMAVSGLTKAELDRALFDQVTVINFNYDRTLEHFLLLALQRFAQVGEGDALRLVNRLKVIRPYGSLGDLIERGVRRRSFGGNSGEMSNDYLELSRSIRTFTEQIADDALENRMFEAIANARVIIFLGFGFHQQNVQLLTCAGSSAAVFGTIAGIAQENVDDLTNGIAKTFGNSVIRPRLYNMTAARLLRDLAPAILMRTSGSVDRRSLRELTIENRLQTSGWVLIFDPLRGGKGKKTISFGADGTVGDGRNDSEFRWSYSGAFLSIFRKDGELQNQFEYDEAIDEFSSVQTLGAHGSHPQRMIPLNRDAV